MLGGQLATGHVLEDPRHEALPVHLGAAHGQALVHHGAERELVHGRREDAEDENAAALAAGDDRLPDGGGPVGLQSQLLLDLVVGTVHARAVGLHADRLDADVGPAATGQLAEFGHHVGRRVVDDLRADVLAHLRQPLGQPVDDEDALGPQQHRRAGGHLPDPAGAPHGDRVPGLGPGQLRAHPPGGHRVGGEQRSQVADLLRDDERADVPVGHPDVLRVAAGEAADRVRVAEATAGLWPHNPSVMPGFGLPLSQREYSSCLQYQQLPQAMKEFTTTRSPTARSRTPLPTSTTSPMNSWPSTSPACIAGM